jgi:SNF2 family DNA or RNA helicase
VSKLTAEDFAEDNPPKFKNNGELRPYQWEGVRWLLFNWMNKKGSILADEMGLGKTLQAVTFIDILATKQVGFCWTVFAGVAWSALTEGTFLVVPGPPGRKFDVRSSLWRLSAHCPTGTLISPSDSLPPAV